MRNLKIKGWVRLHRQIEDNNLWFLESFTKAQAWIDLFLNANHKKGFIQIRGNIINIERGQIGWSELTMVERWRWSKNKVRRFLKLLETEQQIKQQKTFLTTIITILNYDKFQTDEEMIQQTIQQKDSRRYSRRYTNKNDKNVKNDKKERTPSQISQSFFEGNTEELFNEFKTKISLNEGLLKQEFQKFILYWTEPNKSGTKQRWELQPTFDVKRRLATWLGKMKDFKSPKNQPNYVL